MRRPLRDALVFDHRRSESSESSPGAPRSMRSAEVKNENHLKDPLGAAALCGAHARPCTHSQSGEFTCVCVLVFSVFSTQIWLKLNTAQNKRDSSIMFNVSPPSPAPLLLSSLNSFTRNGDFTFREVCVYARVCGRETQRETDRNCWGVFGGVRFRVVVDSARTSDQ